jgi:hypothetical protein
MHDPLKQRDGIDLPKRNIESIAREKCSHKYNWLQLIKELPIPQI